MRYKLALTGAAVLAAFLLATNPVVVHAAKQITGAGIRNNSITGVDIRTNSLTGADVKDGSVTGGDVANNNLTGADLRDGSLTAGDLPLRVAAVATENNAIQSVPVDVDATALTTSITAPAAGLLVISASSEVYGDPGAKASCWIAVDLTEARASQRPLQLSSGAGREICATDMTVRVAKGNHQVHLRAAAEDEGVRYGRSSLSALYVPFGTLTVEREVNPRPSVR